MWAPTSAGSKTVGYALKLNGFNEYVNMGNNLGFERTSARSFVAWVKLSQIAGFSIISKNDQNTGFRVLVDVLPSIRLNLFSNFGSFNYLDVRAAVPNLFDNNWHQIVVTYDGSSTVGGVAIYVDNVSYLTTDLNASGLSGSILTTADFNIGRHSLPNSAGYMPGLLSNVAVYDKVLDATDRTNIYANRNIVNLTSVGPTANLIGYWPVTSADTSSSVNDASSGNHDGTPANMAAENFLRIMDADLVQQATVGYSINLDGVDESVSMGNNFNFERTDPFSLVCWYRTTYRGGTVLFSKNEPESGGTNGRGYHLSPQPDGTLYFKLNNHQLTNKIEVQTIEGGYNDGQWHQVVVTYDGSSNASGTKIYIDSVAQTLNVISNTLNATCIVSNAFNLGKFSTSGVGYFYKGMMSQIAVYNKSLSAAEVTTIYAGRSFANLTSIGPTANLVGYWPITSSDTVSNIDDASSGAHDGTPSNLDTVDFIKTNQLNLFRTKIGSALRLDGTNEYVTMGDVLDFERTDSFTLSCWYRGSSTTGYLISKVVSGSIAGYAIQCNASNGFDFFLNNTGGSNSLLIRATTTINDNNWHHIVATYGGTSNPAGVILYVDGVAVSMSTQVNNLSATTLTVGQLNLGARSNGGAGLLAGDIAQCAIYNKALSAEEVWTIYNLKKFCDLTRVGPFGNLVGYWPIQSSDTNTLIHDSSSGGNNGTGTNLESTDIFTVYDIR